MRFRLTTLCENTVPISQDILGEHGLAILIETEGLKILFDTGQGTSLLHNAQKLGKDLSRLDYVILSHGHYDHSGGLKQLIEKRKDFKVVAHPDIFQKKYGKLPGEEPRYIGIPIDKETLEENTTLNLSRQPIAINESITTTGEIPMKSKYEKIDSGLLVKQGKENLPDKVLDDLALILKTEKGMVVILGCCHRGIINTLLHIIEITKNRKIYAIIGGMHLERASDEQIDQTIMVLKKFGLQKIGVSHCTGFKAAAKLYNAFGEKVFVNKVGQVLEI